jgi:putative endonuclease
MMEKLGIKGFHGLTTLAIFENMAEHNETGKTGEALAAAYLGKIGMEVLHTNYRDGKNEVDIIASKGTTLHFIEVKTKAGNSLGLPESRVNQAKITRMKRVAENYCYQNPAWKFVQFDILSITMQQGVEEEYFLIEDVF